MASEDVLVTPPIRQSVEDANSAQANGIAQPMTEKSWYLFWDQLGKMANRQRWMVSVGTHADRPPATNMPNGAIYVEFDREVIYQNWSGAWQYLAGTMYGTLVPDQRPTDLDSHDGGFDFRTNVAPPREFIWSDTEWVEVTPVTVGTHTDRPASATEAEGNLYVEYDRGGVIYQNWAGGWQYLAGTMYGTLVPDQRPTDLGTPDAGFDFRTNSAPAREFIWSGTAWVEKGVDYRVNGALIGTRPALNLIAGSNVTISGADNAGSDRVDVTVSSSGGGGSGGTVLSVFGRTGAVVAQAGDYSAYEVTNAVDQTSSYTNPPWILSLPWSKITGAPATGVSSVFGRTGAVVAAAGDYTAAQVTNAVSTIGSYADPAWITSLAWSKITGLSLTHPNAVTRVGSSGQIVEGGITDLSPANSNSVYVTATGNVGIGTTAALYSLDVRTPGTVVTQLHLNSANTDTGAYLTGADSNTAVLSAGTSYSGGWIARATSATQITQSAGAISFQTDTGLTAGSGYTPTTRMTITSSGPVGIGTNPSGATRLHVAGSGGSASLFVGASASASGGAAGDIALAREAAPATAVIFFGNAGHYIYHDGTTFNFSPATSNLPSDARLKQNVRDLTGGLDVINRIRPIEAEWNGLGGTAKGRRVVSVLAQELEKILPGAIGTYRTPDGEEFLSYNPDEILFQMVLAIQQLAARIS